MDKYPLWEITDIDYFEYDALLVVDEQRHYFQFDPDKGPTLGGALKYLFLEGLISISKGEINDHQ